MRIVVVGGGFLRERLAAILRDAGHAVIVASLEPGANALAQGALFRAVDGAEALVDLTDPLSFTSKAVLDVYPALARDLSTAAALAKVHHHVALSTTGVDSIRSGGYFRIKAVQEALIRSSSTPYTIVRSTQSLELIESVLRFGADSRAVIRLPVALVQPIAADDLAEALAAIASCPPKNATVELAGPEPIYLQELARLILSAHEDPRGVIASRDARYFGAILSDYSLMPGPAPQIASTAPREWLRRMIPAG